MKSLFSNLLSELSSTPEGTTYQALIIIHSPDKTYSGSNAYHLMNFSQEGQPQYSPNQTITHPVVVTSQGSETLTRVKGPFDEEGKNILGMTVPMTRTYHINSASDALDTIYPEKSVDVHEIYHRLVKKMMPGIERYGDDLEELTVRKVTDKLEKTNSAEAYKVGIKEKFRFYDANYAEEIERAAEDISKEILKQPVKIYLPTNTKEEELLKNNQLPPHVNTAA